MGLLLYPTATEAQVPFDVMINPCIVTSYNPPANYKWDYLVGNRQANYIFNFNQFPCKYNQKFTAALKNGHKLPRFMTLSETQGYFRVYSTDSTADAGSYDVVITGQLDNLDLFGNPSSTIDPSLKIDKLNPPSTFIYKSSFTIHLNV